MAELIYNLTEAAFKMTCALWIILLMAVIGLPLRVGAKGVTESDSARPVNDGELRMTRE